MSKRLNLFIRVFVLALLMAGFSLFFSMPGGSLWLIASVAIAMAVALVAALVATALVTRHVVWGGEPTAEGSLSRVRPGQDDAGATTAYHYRLTSRFGYYVKIHATDSAVSVSGPRLSPGLYAFFIGGQVLLMLLVYVALLAAVVNWEWRYLPVALGLFVGNFVFTLACAGGLWALPDVMALYILPSSRSNMLFATRFTGFAP